MSFVRSLYLGVLVASASWAFLSAVFLLRSPEEGDRGVAWFWAGVYVASSFVSAECFWGLL